MLNIDFIALLKLINVNKLEYICLVSSPLRHSSLIYMIENNKKNNYKKVLLLLKKKEWMQPQERRDSSNQEQE